MSKIDVKTALVNLNQLKINEGQIEGVPKNPRFIKNKDFKNLINSILVFPKMLYLRPITYANDFIVLGGNQRKEALIEIATLSFPKVKETLENNVEFQDKPQEDKEWILQFWQDFFNAEIKQVPAQDATGFSIAEMTEFVVKDNVGFGEYDFEIINLDWDVEKIKRWDDKIDWGSDDKGGGKDPFIDEGIVAQNQFGVIVMCRDEKDQQAIFERFQNDGYICKIVVT